MAQYTLNGGNEQVTTDPTGNVISSASLTPVPTIQPVTPTPDTTNYGGITGGVTQSVIDEYKTLNQQQIDKQNQQDTNASAITDLMGQISGKTADTQAANDAAGVNTETTSLNKYTQQLADLNGQASSLNREAQAIPIQIQQNAAGQGQTDAGVAPLQAGALRLNALKALSIGQQADVAAAAATGSQLRLQAAKDKAQQIVDLKYKPLEDQLALRQKQYDLNKDALDRIDKQKSTAEQVAINKEAQDLADKKSKEQAVQNIAVEAAKAGASPDIMKAIQNSKDVVSAINAAAPALGAKVAADAKQQIFDNAIKLRNAQNDSARVAIEQENANINLLKLQQNQSNASKSAANAVVSTPSGKKYVDGSNLDAAGKTAALNAGQVVLSGQSAQAMTAITNVEGQMGNLLSSLQGAGVDLTKTTSGPGVTLNQGGTNGFLQYWSAGSATPAVQTFGSNLKSMISDLQKLPSTGALVSVLQNNNLTGKESASEMQTKITNIAKALNDAENNLLVDNSQPAQQKLPDGTIVTLQADGTYR